MQEVVVNTWCDRHAIAGEKVAGEAFALSLPGHPGRELDLCPTCRSDMFDELLRLVVDRSRPAQPPTTKAAGKARKAQAGVAVGPSSEGQGQLELDGEAAEPILDCPVCGATSKSFNGLGQHVRNHHGMTLGQLVGNVCPVCATEYRPLSVHGTQAHRAGNVLELLVQGEQLGDPHGVAARVRATFEQAAA